MSSNLGEGRLVSVRRLAGEAFVTARARITDLTYGLYLEHEAILSLRKLADQRRGGRVTAAEFEKQALELLIPPADHTTRSPR